MLCSSGGAPPSRYPALPAHTGSLGLPTLGGAGVHALRG